MKDFVYGFGFGVLAWVILAISFPGVFDDTVDLIRNVASTIWESIFDLFGFF